MAKLFSRATEMRSLKALCSPTQEVVGFARAQLTEECFHFPESRELFKYILRYSDRKGQAPDWDTLSSVIKLSERVRTVLETKVPPVKRMQTVKHVCDEIHDLRKIRTLYSMTKKVQELLVSDTVDIETVQDVIADAQAASRTRASLDDSFFHMGRDNNTTDLVHEVLFGEDKDQWIPTCWKVFDDANGGLPRGGLVCIAGQSGAGKSHVCTQLSVSQARLGYKVVVVPLEMSEGEMYTRILANISKVDSLRISLKRLAADEQKSIYRKYKTESRKIEEAGGRLTVFRPREDLTIEEVLNVCHAYNPDVIYIDYIGLLAGADGDDQWKKLGQIARYGKVYAGNHNKCVVLAAQLSEEGKIRYSQAIKEHSSLAFAFAANQESRDGQYLDMQMIKSRNQMAMKFRLHVDYATSTVCDMKADEELDASDTKTPAAERKRVTREVPESQEATAGFLDDLLDGDKDVRDIDHDPKTDYVHPITKRRMVVDEGKREVFYRRLMRRAIKARDSGQDTKEFESYIYPTKNKVHSVEPEDFESFYQWLYDRMRKTEAVYDEAT